MHVPWLWRVESTAWLCEETKKEEQEANNHESTYKKKTPAKQDIIHVLQVLLQVILKH